MGDRDDATGRADTATTAGAGPDAEAGGPRWYGEGLRFACTGCGRCCTGVTGYVWVSVPEIQALAARMGLSLDEFGRRYLRRVGSRYALVDRGSGDCVFLEGRSCSVYEDRPAQCRAFPWWPGVVESPRSWREAAEGCEGIREDAPLVVAEVIDAALAVARKAGMGRG